jgi:peptide deformylase
VAKLKIYTYPDAVLAQKAKPIARLDKSYYQTTDNMLETMYDAPGIGLAANQVGILERFVVIDVDYEYGDPETGIPYTEEEMETMHDSGVIVRKNPIVLYNPRIIYKEGTTTYPEGCLSVPDFRSDVKRAEKVKVEYQDVDGLTKTLAADGVLAVCIQHELDHLDGKLFIDRIDPFQADIVKKKIMKTGRGR